MLFQATLDIFLKYARDERLIRDAFHQRACLQGFEIFAGYPNVDATVFPERRARILLISLQLAFFVADALPLAGIKGLDELFLLFVELRVRRVSGIAAERRSGKQAKRPTAPCLQHGKMFAVERRRRPYSKTLAGLFQKTRHIKRCMRQTISQKVLAMTPRRTEYFFPEGH